MGDPREETTTESSLGSVTVLPLTLARLLLRTADESRRELLLAEFMEGYTYAAVTTQDHEALCVDEPSLIGDLRWDALVAGLADYLAQRDGFAAPAWVDQLDRSSATLWYFLDLPSARAAADRDTPDAFRRRGVMIRPLEFSRA